jgi:hypothetical protein
VVSGLAHHARALVAGYGLTLALLALRQVAIRNAGRIRAHTTGGASGRSGVRRPTRSSAHSPR